MRTYKPPNNLHHNVRALLLVRTSRAAIMEAVASTVPHTLNS